MRALPVSKARRLTPWDAVVPAAAFASLLLASAVAAGKRPLWHDEIYSWMSVTDPSFRHMLFGIDHAAESVPGLYHVLARGWIVLFGASPFTLRLFSSFGIGVALLAAWFTLRRAFSLRATAMGILASFCTSSLVLFQNSEARFYGAFLGMAALALLVWERSAEQRRAGTSILAFTFLSHGALVQVHVFGLPYSGMLLVALLAWDWSQGWFRPALYSAVVLSWATLLAWIGGYRRTAEVLQPHSWVAAPTFNQLLDVYRFQSPYLALLLLVVALLLCLERIWRRRSDAAIWVAEDRRLLLVLGILGVALMAATQNVFLGLLDLALAGAAVAALGSATGLGRGDAAKELVFRQRALLVAAACWLAVPGVMYAISRVAKPVFVLRYLIPSTLGAAVVLAWLIERGLRGIEESEDRRARGLKLGWAVLLAILVAWPLVEARQLPREETPLYGTSLPGVEALVPEGVPVVVEDALSFLPLAVQSRRPDRPYYFLLDLPPALNPSSPLRAVTAFRDMLIWKNVGYLSDRILPAKEFLPGHPRFVVLHSPQFLWYESRLRDNPAYRFRKLGKVGESEVVLVERNDEGASYVTLRPAGGQN